MAIAALVIIGCGVAAYIALGLVDERTQYREELRLSITNPHERNAMYAWKVSVGPYVGIVIASSEKKARKLAKQCVKVRAPGQPVRKVKLLGKVGEFASPGCSPAACPYWKAS